MFTKSDLTGASRNVLLSEDANIGITLNTLVGSGTVVGQTEMFAADTVYYLNPEKKYHPEYKHPKMLRLERPTILHTGVTRTVTVDNLDRALEVVNIEGIRDGLASLQG